MPNKEIVTIQVGNYANYVGTHWWNLQESSFSYDPKEPSEINNDVMFREGLTQRGTSTYLPRLISIDLKGSLGTLKEDGVLYDTPGKSEIPIWSESVDVHKSERLPKNEFLLHLDKLESESSLVTPRVDDDKDVCQASCSTPLSPNPVYNLDRKVRFWSDYLCTHLHPRSIHLITQFKHGNEIEPFDSYFDGQRLMSCVNEIEEIEDRIRYFAEECDRLQGFHMLFDAANGFGGIAAAVATYISDEFSRKGVISLPLYDITSEKLINPKWSTTVINSFLCLENLGTLCDVTVPLSCHDVIWQPQVSPRKFPFIEYRSHLPYHTSAILSSALDTASLVYRIKNNTHVLNDVVDGLTINGRKFAALSTLLPIPVYEDASIIETLMKLEYEVLPQSLTPGCGSSSLGGSLNQSIVTRGLPLQLKINASAIVASLGRHGTYENLGDVVNWYLNQTSPSKYTTLTSVSTPLSICDPFPHILDSRISINGMICKDNRPQLSGVTSLKCISGLHSANSLRNMLEDLIKNVTRCIRGNSFDYFGLEKDEYLHIMESLKRHKGCYE